MATSSIDEQRAALLEIAEAVAPGWERHRAEIEEIATPVREWMLHMLRPQNRDTILELAAGIGHTGLEAAGILRPSGRLITSDLSPAMLAAARRRGAELGVENVDYDGRFTFADADGYLSPIADTAGPIALALQRLTENERAAVRADVVDSLQRFATDGVYELPCVALCAAASGTPRANPDKERAR